MSRVPVRPYLVAKDAEGRVRLTVRETRYNSQGYPLITSTLQDEDFPTIARAMAHARETFGAVAGEFARS